MISRKRRVYSEEKAPPTKLAKQIRNLVLEDADPDPEMDGVEGEDFIYISYKDWLDQINEIEVDDRFMKIPDQVKAVPGRDLQTSQDPEANPVAKSTQSDATNRSNNMTLIPYTPQIGNGFGYSK